MLPSTQRRTNGGKATDRSTTQTTDPGTFAVPSHRWPESTEGESVSVEDVYVDVPEGLEIPSDLGQSTTVNA